MAGVLIALALNAWWDGRQHAREASGLRAEIHVDVDQTREIVARDLATSREVERKARRILTVMSSVDANRDSVLATLGSVFVLKRWEPVNDTYTEALGSGRLSQLKSRSLRLALSRYQTQIEYVRAVVQWFATAYYEEQEPWMVANTAYSEIAHDVRRGDLIQGPFRTDFVRMAKSRELWNLLTLRLELEVALQAVLQELEKRASAVITAIDQ